MRGPPVRARHHRRPTHSRRRGDGQPGPAHPRPPRGDVRTKPSGRPGRDHLRRDHRQPGHARLPVAAQSPCRRFGPARSPTTAPGSWNGSRRGRSTPPSSPSPARWCCPAVLPTRSAGRTGSRSSSLTAATCLGSTGAGRAGRRHLHDRPLRRGARQTTDRSGSDPSAHGHSGDGRSHGAPARSAGGAAAVPAARLRRRRGEGAGRSGAGRPPPVPGHAACRSTPGGAARSRWSATRWDCLRRVAERAADVTRRGAKVAGPRQEGSDGDLL